MTKEQLAKLGIVIDGNELPDSEALALIEQKFGTLNGDLKKHKDLLSARNGEIAEYKRKEQEKLSDDEKRALHYQELEETNKTLTRKLALNEKIKDYIAIGYSEELATKVANAELDGKPTANYHKEFITAREESLRAELLKGNPQPHTNGDPKPLTLDDLKKMSYEELLKTQETNPELVNEYLGNQNKN